MSKLNTHTLYGYQAEGGAYFETMSVSYQVFGKVLHTAPVVLVNHALTGNSDVLSPEKGWWKEIIGPNKLIDTTVYTVVAFNIPGNGYDGQVFDNYNALKARDIAQIFHNVLIELKVLQLYAIIGGSLGGGIAWEMACRYPNFSKYVIPVASDWKSSDWIIGHNVVQESILHNSSKPLEDARKMAMLFYRSPEGFSRKFNRTTNGKSYKVESWLNHHGKKLNDRFKVKAYLLMNHLLSSIDILEGASDTREIFGKIESIIIQIAVSSDLFFVKEENLKTKKILDELGIPNEYHEIQSHEGHDAFLIEHEQITHFLSPIFKTD